MSITLSLTWVKSRKRIVASLIVVIVIIISTIGAETYNLHARDNVPPFAVAEVDKRVVRIGENFHFDSEGSKGDIKTYLWEFDDGNTSADPGPIHAYEEPGFYNVTLTVVDVRGHADNATLQVGAQIEDVHMTDDTGRRHDIRPQWMSGSGATPTIGPNIGWPTVDGSVHVTRPIGTFHLEVELRWGEGDDVHFETLLTQDTTSVGQDIDLPFVIPPDKFPEGSCPCPALLEVIFWVDQGEWYSIHIAVNAAFPMELTASP